MADVQPLSSGRRVRNLGPSSGVRFTSLSNNRRRPSGSSAASKSRPHPSNDKPSERPAPRGSASRLSDWRRALFTYLGGGVLLCIEDAEPSVVPRPEARGAAARRGPCPVTTPGTNIGVIRLTWWSDVFGRRGRVAASLTQAGRRRGAWPGTPRCLLGGAAASWRYEDSWAGRGRGFGVSMRVVYIGGCRLFCGLCRVFSAACHG